MFYVTLLLRLFFFTTKYILFISLCLSLFFSYTSLHYLCLYFFHLYIFLPTRLCFMLIYLAFFLHFKSFSFSFKTVHFRLLIFIIFFHFHSFFFLFSMYFFIFSLLQNLILFIYLFVIRYFFNLKPQTFYVTIFHSYNFHFQVTNFFLFFIFYYYFDSCPL